tara:strand:- start:3033 stop:4187 length:1155 start_codon:yes stop_codon:yes gene_type:complete
MISRTLFFSFTCLFPLTGFAEEAIDPERAANTIILDDIGVANLRIKTEPVLETDFETTVFAIGRIHEIPARRAALSSRIPGSIKSINVYEGDFVKRGQVLAVVESRQPGNPPPSVGIESPIAGMVIASHVRIGQPVEPAEELLDISDRSNMWAVARIPEQENAATKIGAKARIRVPALGDETIVATLTRYGTSADDKTGTVEGIFEIPNPDLKLQPGMRAEFNIITSTRDWVMAVPREAVQGDPTKRLVFVKDFDLPNAFVKAPLVLGERNDRYFEVIQGLFPGDEVVTKGSYELSFAGSGGGMSLKEALDAAHGHEHNEDGSEMTAEQKAAAESEGDGHGHGAGGEPGMLDWIIRIWAAVATVLLLVWLQAILRKRKSQPVAA